MIDSEAKINKAHEYIGMICQNLNLFPHLLIKKNIMLASINNVEKLFYHIHQFPEFIFKI